MVLWLNIIVYFSHIHYLCSVLCTYKIDHFCYHKATWQNRCSHQGRSQCEKKGKRSSLYKHWQETRFLRSPCESGGMDYSSSPILRSPCESGGRDYSSSPILRSPCESGGRDYSSSPILVGHVWLLLLVTAGCLGISLLVLGAEMKLGELGKVPQEEKVPSSRIS